MSRDSTQPDTADQRRRSILDAAAGLLAEGGYGALSLRSLAARAGISLGLSYYYFADKHTVFEALMQEQQRVMIDFLDAQPREPGVAALLRAMVPVAEVQWRQVGRMVAVWRVERPEDAADSATAGNQRLAMAAAQFAALGRALEECAAAEGRRLISDPEVVPFVWAGLMGLADLHAHGWTEPIDADRLTDLTLTSLVSTVLVPE
ncbi:TetR/AcrR family transcriptional regulator [Nocardioides sp. JQ2195]|uniref:TetR/AcrR family transcriptional regulator n=1 Tax=Nocardioides sp. JQ2195 TaxID=2592334 RepID=UPI00143E43EB|nr:TetR/AcrR family transcriptional regulator [Nocardioides sp. JQ2195]QIX26487.1 TetR/AcrR family transcriptional regulator [Nocardioides sp. JQ2195]